MADIAVESLGDTRYRVTVVEESHRADHVVVVTPRDVARYAPGASPERLLEASFEFLLARESPGAILSTFALSVIERYFPEYPRVIRELVRP